MKKNLSMLAAVLTASAALTGCSSELAEVQKQVQAEEAQTYTLVINATKPGNDALTRAIEESGSSLSTTWGEGEKVYAYINDATADDDAIELTPQTTGVKATTLTGTVTKTGGFTTSDVLHLYYLKKQSAYNNYTGQVGTLPDIASKFDYATATVNITAVGPTDIYSTDNILATSNATFERQQAISKFTLSKKGTTDDLDVTPLTIKSDALTADLEVTPASGAHVIWVALPIPGSEKAYKFEATADSKAYGITKSINMQKGKYYTATLAMGRDAEKLNVTGLPDASVSYSGTAVNITDVKSSENDDMTADTDYETKYYKNTGTAESPTWTECEAADVKNAGDYKAVITGKGEYEGTFEKEFSVSKMSASDVQDAIRNNTIPATTNVETTLTAGGTAVPIVLSGKDVLGMNSKDLKDYVSITTVPDGIATINENGEIVTTGGGTITLTISLPESDNYEEASVVKTIYVKQSGIGGTLDDPTTGSWDD